MGENFCLKIDYFRIDENDFETDLWRIIETYPKLRLFFRGGGCSRSTSPHAFDFPLIIQAVFLNFTYSVTSHSVDIDINITLCIRYASTEREGSVAAPGQPQ